MAAVWAALKNFDAVVGVRVVGSGNIDGEIESHFVKTIIDSGSGEDAGAAVFDAEGFAGRGEVLQNPRGRFAGVAG